MRERERAQGATVQERAAKITALFVAAAAIASSCTCEPTGGRARPDVSASAGASAAPTSAPAASSGAAAASSPSSSAQEAAPTAQAGQKKFVRQRPEERNSVDACAYLGFEGFACLEALLAEKDPVARRYMRRMSDADARISKDLYARGEAPGVPHAELTMLCADSGPCGRKDENGAVLDDGYMCLTKAQLLTFQGDTREGADAHKRACKCGAERAQIPIMGGFLACDGPNKPVERGGNLSISEAKNIRACAECDADAGPAACAREIATLKPVDPELATYIETVQVPRCEKP